VYDAAGHHIREIQNWMDIFVSMRRNTAGVKVWVTSTGRAISGYNANFGSLGAPRGRCDQAGHSAHRHSGTHTHASDCGSVIVERRNGDDDGGPSGQHAFLRRVRELWMNTTTSDLPHRVNGHVRRLKNHGSNERHTRDGRRRQLQHGQLRR
jgi:hypothetical protein